jgi:FkbM family methyltransferase
VIAFEPHPVVFDVLSHHAARWNADHRLASVDARCLAASDQGGEGWLTANTGPQQMGIAALRQAEQTSVRGDYEVEKATLDSLLEGHRLQLLKIDVEGHEYAVLRGAEALLSERRIRDVVFEDFETYPTPAMTLLEEHGMTVFTLDRSLFGLRVYPVSQGPAPRVWPGRNYLATLAPARALARLERRGWRSLRPGRRERVPVRN